LAKSASISAAEPGWLTARRERAVALKGELELPAFRGIPGWEFTEIKGLDLDSYAVVTGGEEGGLERVEPLFAEHAPDTLHIEQVDDVWIAPAPGADDGPVVLPLSVAAETHAEIVEKHLGTVVTARTPFTARNDAHWSGGAFVYVPAGVKVDVPILLTAVHEQPGTALHWRTLVVLEEGAQAEVWQQALSPDDDSDGLYNSVVELVVGPNASLRFVDGQDLGEKRWVFGQHRSVVERDGSLDWITLGFGSGNGKVFLETKLAGAGAHTAVTGAYATRGRQHLDFDTLQEHAAPNTTSDLAFRGILDGRSTAVWRGMIKVDPGAQQTDAFQESRNLLLSKRSHADAIPGLEILANDVRCTHAAAIAQIDREQLFYLRSHGLPEPVARRLVIEGFLQGLVERFADGPVRRVVTRALEARLERVLGPSDA
jgi:Fe-S cluster assembly protein SufD